MKNSIYLVFLSFSMTLGAQKTAFIPIKITEEQSVLPKTNPDLIKINDSVPVLIPQKKNGKYGFINQNGKTIIKHEYSNVGFFTEDCRILNAPDEKIKEFGSEKYASVHLNGTDFRIDESGKRTYKFKDSDLGKCSLEYKSQLFYAYVKNGFYGVIEKARFRNPDDYRDFTIYPAYEYLHILEGNDLKNPMIIATLKDKFGVIDINNKIIIPFEYSDIKRNYSWKIARLFEVTKDGENYYFVDADNKSY